MTPPCFSTSNRCTLPMCHSTPINNSTKPHLLMPTRCTTPKNSCTSRGTSTTRSCIRYRLRARPSSAKIPSTWTKSSCNNDKCPQNNRANQRSPNKLIASKPRPSPNNSTRTNQKFQRRPAGQAQPKSPIQSLAILMRRRATPSSQPSSSWDLSSRLTDPKKAKCWYCLIRSPDLHARRVEVAICKKNLKRLTLPSSNSF